MRDYDVLMVEANSVPTEDLEKKDHRLLIRTTDAMGADCVELARKLGIPIETVVTDILSVGFKSLSALANGNSHATVLLKDGKLVVEASKGGHPQQT